MVILLQNSVKGDVQELSKNQLIEVCGHYNYGLYNLPPIDVKTSIKDKLKKLLDNVK